VRRDRPHAAPASRQGGGYTVGGRDVGQLSPAVQFGTAGVDSPSSSRHEHPVEAAPCQRRSELVAAPCRWPSPRAPRTARPRPGAPRVLAVRVVRAPPSSSLTATRAAAASAEPPPMPPATGTPLRMSRWMPPRDPAAPRRAARRARRG
jgi:hypothetical protein